MPAAKKSWLHKRLKLSPHKHTFKRLPTQHTSRGALVVLSVAAGLLLLYVTKSYSANADALTGSGSLGLSGLVKPTTAATLDQPVNKQVFNTKEITVSGSCPTSPPNNIVKVIDNGIVGVAPCDNGRYELKIDLLPGVNYLRSRISDIYNHTGPDSTVIKVYYRYPNGPLSPFNIGIQSSVFSAGIDKPFGIKVIMSGGRAPFAFNINWGDGASDVISKPTGSDLDIQHQYQGAAQYEIMVNASDSAGQKAYAQSPVLVSGPAAIAGGINQNNNWSYGGSVLRTLLPIYTLVVGGVFVFWLGERFEHNRILHLTKSRRLKH